MAFNDEMIGPGVGDGRLDFTLRFEQWIFTILPTVLLIIVTPFYFRRLIREPAAVRAGFLLPIKLVSYYKICFELRSYSLCIHYVVFVFLCLLML